MADKGFDFKRGDSIASSSVSASSGVSGFRTARSVKCVNIFKLIIASLPTIVFGIFTIVFSLQQNAAAKATREQDQRQADEINQRVLFKEYMDDMRELLLDERFEQNTNKSLLQIRVQTLTVLKSLDINRKRDVFRFLYESRLIRHDYEWHIDIRGADFSGIKLVQSSSEACALPFLYLPGVNAENIIFDGCSLTDAVFESASMTGAKFMLNDLIHADFHNAILNRAEFRDNQLFRASFNGAMLTASTLLGSIFHSVDFSNVDLYEAVVDNALLNAATYPGFQASTLTNSRLPNGSFFSIDSQNLIRGSNAKEECPMNFTTAWVGSTNEKPATIVHFNATFPEIVSKVNDDCFYRFDKEISYYQIISLQNFSHIIDLNLAALNLSILAGLKNPNTIDSMGASAHFSQNKNAFDYASSVSIIFSNLTSFQYRSLIANIPPKTRFVVVTLGCEVRSLGDQYCLADSITLSVHQTTPKVR